MSASAELEHFCGYGGKHFNTVRYHPQKAETLIYSAAAALIIEDVNDPHRQEFLRGHDQEVSALDVSANGRLVASGQLGSTSRKGAVAPVIVWDFDNRSLYREFSGLAHSVLCVKFSPDGRFLVATGANQYIYVWDVSTGEVVYSRRTESPCFLAVWGPITNTDTRYPSYQLCTTFDSQVLVHDMSFDIRSMSYTLSSEPVQFPPSGLQRKHVCGLVRDGYLITGTAAGDLCIFGVSARVFRSALPVCNGGVSSLTCHGETIFVAGGDGRVKALRGADTRWDVLAENVLEAGASAVTVSADGAELAIGTRNGKLWRLLSSDLSATLQAATHTDEVTDVAFGVSSDQVCTTSKAGEALLLNLSDYLPVMASYNKAPARTCTLATSTGELLVGYEDGSLRAWPLTGSAPAMLWELQAHRGGVTAVRESGNFIATGGNDCAVRFWHRTTRELLASFTNHCKPVEDLLIDQALPNLVHSGSEDKLVITYDLKQNKPLVQHMTHSNVTGISQRKDREKEVVSCSTDGKILFWDIDYPEATGCIKPPAAFGVKLRCIEVSPTGRFIAAGAEDSRLYIYDLMSCSCVQECEGHAGGITSVRWSPDQKQIVTGGRDGCVIVWNFFEL